MSKQCPEMRCRTLSIRPCALLCYIVFMNSDIDVLKIPAFQRKKSLAKRAEKVIPWTALDRQRQAILKEQKKVNKYVNPVAPVKSRKSNVAFSSPVSSFVSSFEPPIDLSQSKSFSIKPSLSAPVAPFPSSRYRIIGTVTHYLDRIQVAIIHLSSSLKKDDPVAIEDENGIFFQTVSSMQINRKDVKTAKKGSEIGMKVNQIPKVGGKVFKAKLPS